MRLQKEFAEQGIRWSRDRLQCQMFTNEVWAMGEAYTTSFVTVLEDGSDRYLSKNLQHKYFKAPAWMFHGSIVNRRKGPAVFWEKEWGNINSTKYDEHVLVGIAEFMQGTQYIFMQDNAPSHRSLETRMNLLDRGI